MDIYKKLKFYTSLPYHALGTERRMKFTMRHDFLIDRALHDMERGVTDEQIAPEEVVVSLTTYGKRFHDVAATIESIMQGTQKPNRITLWLGEALRDTPLPILLQRQQSRGLEVHYCKDVGPHTTNIS